MPRDLFCKDDTLVGGYVPRPVAERFNLLILSENTSRSKAILALISAYVNAHDTPTVLIERVAEQIHDNFLQKQKSNRSAEFKEYLNTVRPWLDRRKINSDHSELIIKRVTQLHAKNKI